MSKLLDYVTSCTPAGLRRFENKLDDPKSRDFGSRAITAAASQGLAAGQSSGGSASPAGSESGAPLRRPWVADGGAALERCQHCKHPAVCPSVLERRPSDRQTRCPHPHRNFRHIIYSHERHSSVSSFAGFAY